MVVLSPGSPERQGGRFLQPKQMMTGNVIGDRGRAVLKFESPGVGSLCVPYECQTGKEGKGRKKQKRTRASPGHMD